MLFEVTLEFYFDLYGQTLVISYTFYPFSQWNKQVIHLQSLTLVSWESFSLMIQTQRVLRVSMAGHPKFWKRCLGKGALR